MKKYNFLNLILLLSLSICFGKQITSGVSYHKAKKSKESTQNIYVIEIDPQQIDFTLEHALGQGTDREEVSHIAARTNALVATNECNYRRGGRFNGNSVNLSIINKKIIADPQLYTSAIGWSKKDNKVKIGKIKVEWDLVIGEKKYPVTRVNQPSASDEAIIYTPTFRNTTLTGPENIEIIVKKGKIKKVNYKGNNKIPKNGFVYSLSSVIEYDANDFIKGMPVQLSYTFVSEDDLPWEDMDFIIGGAGRLIKNGQVVKDMDDDFKGGKQIVHSHDEAAADFVKNDERTWLIEGSHPRTAIGIKSNGNLVLVVVDGRQPGISEGLTLYELADFMKSLECIEALNIGGGGCTTLCLNGEVINKPSSGCERPVSEAFIVKAKA